MSNKIKIWILVLMIFEGYKSFAVEIPKSFIKKFLPDNPVILEAGASNGSDTVEMAKMWPRGKIYCFEPLPQWFAFVKNRTKELANIFCYQLALSDKSGTAEFFVSSNNGASSSLLAPGKLLVGHSTLKFNEVISVKTITLDEWAKKEGVKSIDFIWFDMQGKEPDVLMASPNILKTVKVIYTEISRDELYKGQILYPEFKKFLQTQGFTEIYESHGGFHADALFIKSNKNQVQLYTGN